MGSVVVFLFGEAVEKKLATLLLVEKPLTSFSLHNLAFVSHPGNPVLFISLPLTVDMLL